MVNLSHRNNVLIIIASLLFSLNINAGNTLTAKEQKEAGKAAMQVIRNFMGDSSQELKIVLNLSLAKDDNGCDRYSYDYSTPTLTIQASSGVSACHAFYEFVKSNKAGICSWTANRFAMPETLTKNHQEVCTSPYRDHQYLNVVTYGYSIPYWDAERWDQEIDWMALHGIDMPLMLVGAEGIYFDVFTKDFHIPAADVHNWEVGPAHLPWMRMGNLAGKMFDGPLDSHWYKQQKALAHHILKRMKALGMKPICPAFGGFVPPTFADHNPEATLTNTGWDWVLARGEQNTRLNPDSKDFVNVGKAFIKRWEKEFSRSYPGLKYYLSDSFNEMEVPGAEQLRIYGKNIYRSIAEGSQHPEAVWVTQGWDFVYGAEKWTNGRTQSEKFRALTESVPDHRFMVLYMSPEYGGYGNKTWETLDNFNGKDWIYTMLPNMGGKNFWTGCLNDYASTFPTNLYNSPGKANCTGWGLTMEGIEYNEILYEFIADMGWTDPAKGQDIGRWMEQYGQCRYGEYYQPMRQFHSALLNSVYQVYKDHQTFGWQGYNRGDHYYTPGNIDYLNEVFYWGIESLFSEKSLRTLPEKLSPTLRADLIEAAAFYASARIEKIAQHIADLSNSGKNTEAKTLLSRLEHIILTLDAVLSVHPLYDLQKWEDKAMKAAGKDRERQKQYVRDARSIVSTWHSNHGTEPNAHEPVNDYSGRLWAGLIRGYYWPRMKAELEGLINGTTVNLRTIENDFVDTSKNTSLPPTTIVIDESEIISILKDLVEEARQASTL